MSNWAQINQVSHELWDRFETSCYVGSQPLKTGNSWISLTTVLFFFGRNLLIDSRNGRLWRRPRARWRMGQISGKFNRCKYSACISAGSTPKLWVMILLKKNPLLINKNDWFMSKNWFFYLEITENNRFTIIWSHNWPSHNRPSPIRGLLRPPGVGGEDAEGGALPGLRGLTQVQEDDRGGGNGWHPTRVRTNKHQLRMFPQEIIWYEYEELKNLFRPLR